MNVLGLVWRGEGVVEVSVPSSMPTARESASQSMLLGILSFKSIWGEGDQGMSCLLNNLYSLSLSVSACLPLWIRLRLRLRFPLPLAASPSLAASSLPAPLSLHH